MSKPERPREMPDDLVVHLPAWVCASVYCSKDSRDVKVKTIILYIHSYNLVHGYSSE